MKQHAYDDCIGRFAYGAENNSGQHLVNFGAISNHLINNTAFQQKPAHVTTWENKQVHPKDLMETIIVYSQIN